MATDGLTSRGILVRLLATLVLVYATWNPEGYSFFHWVFQPLGQGLSVFMHSLNPVKALAAVALLAAWVICVQASRRSLGLGGTVLVLALFGCLIWAMIYYGAISPRSSRVIAHLVLVAVSVVLALGLSWSHITRRLTGQQDTDTVA